MRKKRASLIAFKFLSEILRMIQKETRKPVQIEIFCPIPPLRKLVNFKLTWPGRMVQVRARALDVVVAGAARVFPAHPFWQWMAADAFSREHLRVPSWAGHIQGARWWLAGRLQPVPQSWRGWRGRATRALRRPECVAAHLSAASGRETFARCLPFSALRLLQSRSRDHSGGGGRQEQGWLYSTQWLGLPAAAALLLSFRERADCVAAPSQVKQPKNFVLSTPEQVQKIAGLINALVDMEYWTEAEEQQIFEHAVKLVLEAIEAMLPEPMLRLVIYSDDDDGLDEEAADSLRSRLVEYCKWKLKLPFLDEMDEVRVITGVCAVIVESLKKGNSFARVVEPVNSGELIMDVFVKGSVGLLDEENKREFIETISDGLQIPFLPEKIKIWVVGKVMTEVALVFEQSLLFTYQTRISQAYGWAAERVGAAHMTKAFHELHRSKPHRPGYLWGLRKISAAEYVSQLPLFDSGRLWTNGDLILPTGDSDRFAEEVRDRLVNTLNDRINIIGWVCTKFEEWEGHLIQKLVDVTLLESMDMDKMEGAVEFLSRENFAYALGYEWFECIKVRVRRRACCPAPMEPCVLPLPVPSSPRQPLGPPSGGSPQRASVAGSRADVEGRRLRGESGGWQEEGLPYPVGWRQNEWYWELAKELAKRDMSKICTKQAVVAQPAERHISE